MWVKTACSWADAHGTCHAAAREQAARLCIGQRCIKGTLEIQGSQLGPVPVRSLEQCMHSAQEWLHGRASQEEGLPDSIKMLLQSPWPCQLVHQGLSALRDLHTWTCISHCSS